MEPILSCRIEIKGIGRLFRHAIAYPQAIQHDRYSDGRAQIKISFEMVDTPFSRVRVFHIRPRQYKERHTEVANRGKLSSFFLCVCAGSEGYKTLSTGHRCCVAVLYFPKATTSTSCCNKVINIYLYIRILFSESAKPFFFLFFFFFNVVQKVRTVGHTENDCL